MSKTLIIGLIILIAIPVVIGVPLVAMWCVDTLFGTHIPVTFKTWLAMFLLLGAGHGVKYRSKSD